MTENPDASLGFCQLCGAKRVMASQEFCARCGQKLLQASDITVAAPPQAASANVPPPAIGTAAPEPALAPEPAPFAGSVPEQPPVPGWAPAGDSTSQPPATAPSMGYGYPPAYGQPPAPGAWPGGPIYPGGPYYPGMAPASRRNPALIPILIGIGLVLVLALAGGIYVVASSKSSANPSAGNSLIGAGSTINVALTPTDTPTPEPTPTGTPVPTTANLTGQMVASGAASISGVGVILCQAMDTGCITDPALIATSGASGQFEIDGISEGTYYVLYAPAGGPSSWSSEQSIGINDQTSSCLGEAFMSGLTSECQGSVMFSDDSAMALRDGTLSVAGSAWSLKAGSVCSPKHGLCLDFDNSQPLSVVITPGTPATVDITVRGSE